MAVGLALLAGPVLAGCGDDDDATVDSGAADTTTSIAETDAGEGSEAEGASGSSGEEVDLTGQGDAPTVEIVANDGSFSPSTIMVTAGATVSVDVENAGTTAHTFTIEELDIDEELQPGDTVTVEVVIPDEGSLEFVCRIHGDDGMSGRFEVSAADTGASTTTTALTGGNQDPGSGSAPEGGTVPPDPGGEAGSGGGDPDNEDSSAGGVGSDS